MAARHSLVLALSGGRTKRRHNLLPLLFLSILLFGCRPATPPPGSADQTQMAPGPAIEATSAPAKPTTVPEEVMEVHNGEYQLGAADGLQIVQLSDGDFVQGTQGNDNFLSVTVTDFAAVGDLNADGTDEVAALVSENYGGTGTFVFLAVYANVDGTWTFQTSSMVDDRPELNALSIEAGEIFLDAVIHGTDEPMCCPTLRTTRHYRLVGNILDMTDYTTFTPAGNPRTISIESPADGSETFTSVPIKGSVAIAPFENDLTYRIYDVGGVELSVGAISVTAPDLGAPGTFNAVIPIGNILSGAVIRIEVQDISAADGSLLAMDSVELVVK
ncbi:MAG: hypothetical protein EHM33_21810 [Chloroflexi bacterium]|nr:MAG: hypothetical protein EHM33_21810 [Chloroflexota bacterium]